MSMTTAAVYEMAQKLHESDTEVIPETDVKEEMKPENIENSNNIPENNEDTVDETPAQETVVESEKTENKKPTHEEQEKYAFTKLKNKERQKREKLISDYESKIKSLNDELERFKGLQKDSFKSDEEYVNYLFDRKMKENESNQLQLAKANAEAEAFEEINQQRIMSCFPDEKDRESYMKLIESSAPKFVELLEKADPDNAILSYLDDSDISPLLIRVLMTKPEYRTEILSKRNPYSKVMALDNLAKRLSYAKNFVDKKRNKVSSEKKPLPVIGKVAKSDAGGAELDKSSPNYWNERLKQLNALRGRR